MFTRKLSKQAKFMMLFIVVPLYFYCGSIIVSALLKFGILELGMTLDENSLTAYLNFIIDSLFLLLGFWIFKDQLKEQMKDFMKDWKMNLLYGCVIGFVLIFIANYIGSLFTLFFVGGGSSQNQQMLETIIMKHPLLMIGTTVFLAPLFEEIFFRGTLFAWLYELHPYVAHLVSSFVFGFVHVMNSVLSGQLSEMFQIFSYMFMGFVLSQLYEKRNNIYVPILTHMMNNLVSLLIVLILS